MLPYSLPHLGVSGSSQLALALAQQKQQMSAMPSSGLGLPQHPLLASLPYNSMQTQHMLGQFGTLPFAWPIFPSNPLLPLEYASLLYGTSIPSLAGLTSSLLDKMPTDPTVTVQMQAGPTVANSATTPLLSATSTEDEESEMSHTMMMLSEAASLEMDMLDKPKNRLRRRRHDASDASSSSSTADVDSDSEYEEVQPVAKRPCLQESMQQQHGMTAGVIPPDWLPGGLQLIPGAQLKASAPNAATNTTDIAPPISSDATEPTSSPSSAFEGATNVSASGVAPLASPFRLAHQIIPLPMYPMANATMGSFRPRSGPTDSASSARMLQSLSSLVSPLPSANSAHSLPFYLSMSGALPTSAHTHNSDCDKSSPRSPSKATTSSSSSPSSSVPAAYVNREWAFKHAHSDWAKYNWHVRSGGRYIMTERAHRRYFACDNPDCPAVLYEDSPVEPKTGEVIKGGEMRMTPQKEHNHGPPDHSKPCNELILRAGILLKTMSPAQVRDQLIAEAGNGIGIPSVELITQILEKNRIIRKGKRTLHFAPPHSRS